MEAASMLSTILIVKIRMAMLEMGSLNILLG